MCTDVTLWKAQLDELPAICLLRAGLHSYSALSSPALSPAASARLVNKVGGQTVATGSGRSRVKQVAKQVRSFEGCAWRVLGILAADCACDSMPSCVHE